MERWDSRTPRIPRRAAGPAELRTKSGCDHPNSSLGRQAMRQEELGRGDPIRPQDWCGVLPFEAAAASDRLGWVGLQAARYRTSHAFELNPPGLTHDRLVLFARPPEEFDLRYEGVKRHLPPPAGAISLVPAG